MPETRKFSIHEVREALEKHTGDKIEDLEIEDEQGNKVRGGATGLDALAPRKTSTGRTGVPEVDYPNE